MNELELVATAIFLDRTAGPAIEVAGNLLSDRVRSRIHSLQARVAGKLSSELVNDRIAIKAVQEAVTTDDDVVHAYLAGVLVAAGVDHRQDQGTYLLGLLSQLSTTQIRAHYAIYSAARRLYADLDLNLDDENDCDRFFFYIDLYDLGKTLGLGEDERPHPATYHILLGLRQHGLVGPTGFQGDADYLLNKHGIETPSKAGMYLTLRSLGATLFLAGCGAPSSSAMTLLDRSVELQLPLLDTKPRALKSATVVHRDRS